MRSNNQSRPPPSVLTQQQILQIANQLQHAQSQPQIKSLESQIRHHLSLDKNINIMTTIILSRQTSLPTNQALVTTYNLITQHLLQEYQLSRSKPIQYRRQFTPFSVTNDFGDDIKRNIMNLCGKMEKIVDNMFVPVAWKPNLVYLQLRLYGRSKEDWDSARVGNKMEFYLRKDMIVVGGAFFQNSMKLGFSVKEKIDLVKKVGQHMPNILAKFMVRILRGEGMVQSLEKPSAYSDLSTSLNFVNHILTTAFIQIPIQYLNLWYSPDPMIQTLKALAQQIQSPTQSHPHSSIMQWQQLLPKILKKLMHRLLYHKKVYMYPNFVQFYSQYTKLLWGKYYLKNDINDNNFDGEILGLFQNGIKADQVGGVGGLKECFLGVGGGYTEVLSRDQKVFIIQQYVGKLLNYYHTKIEANLNNLTQGQQITEELSDYMKINASQPEQSSINYAQLFVTLCQTYPQLTSFLKNLIHCLLQSYTLPPQSPAPPSSSSSSQPLSVFETQPKQIQQQEDEVQISKCWWLKQEIQLVCFLGQKFGRQWLLQCGMLMAIFCYRAVMVDRRFLRVVDRFVGKIKRGLDIEGCSIFGAGKTTLAVFLVFFNGYLQEIPLCIRSNKTSRIAQYPLFPLITKISESLSHVQPRLIYSLLLPCLINYITQISSLLQTQKMSPTYISYNTTIAFPQLLLPFSTFTQLLKKIPIRFYTYLYPHILSCHMPSSQFNSLNQIVSKIIQYRGEEQIGIEINKMWYIQYNKKIFNIFYIVVSHEEYIEIFQPVLDWVYGLLGGVSGNGLVEFGVEARELCVRVLGYPHIVAALSQTIKAKLWQIVYMLLSRYEWKPYTAQVQSNQRSGAKLLALPRQQKSQLLLFHLTSTQPKLPPKLLHTLFQQSIVTLQKISQQILQKKQNLKQTKHRHYQLQEICFLLCLHKLIANNGEGDGDGDGDRNEYNDGNADIAGVYVNSVLELVVGNFQYRALCPEEFNYVNGKYGLLVVFMINFWFETVWHNMKGRGQDIVKKIFHQTFYKDKWYRIQYDAPHYIINTVDIISKLWKQKTQLSNCEYILKYAHFAVGGCILCMDRIYQNYRFNRQQQLQISVFNLQLTDPIIQADTQTTKFLNYLCKTDPYIDQFKYFNNFLQKLRTNADVFYWFNKAMQIYIRTQVFMERFIQIFLIRKIQKNNGVIVYRVVRNIGQGSRLQKGWRRGWRDDDQFQFMPEILQEEERLKKLRAQGIIVDREDDSDDGSEYDDAIGQYSNEQP